MNLFWSRKGRFGLMFLATAAVGALVSIPNVALGVLPVAESFFASVPMPIGVAASPSQLLVTTPYCNSVVNNVLQPRRVVSIGTDGTVHPFATVPSPAGGTCREEYIAIAPAAANFLDAGTVTDPLVPNRRFSQNESGWAAGFVYVTQGSTIIKIAPDGSAQNDNFATLGSCTSTHTSITFDRTGGFGHDMIATCQNGNVYEVNKAGVATLKGTISGATGFLEGPDVAPTTGFSPFNGQLLVTSESAGQVFALSTNGTQSTVSNIAGAEGVAIIPSPLCSFGSSGGAYFSAVFGNDSISVVLKSAFTDPLMGALVRSENAGTSLLSSDGTTLNTTPKTFSTVATQHEGAAFCIDSVPTNLTGFIQRDPSPGSDSINPGASGLITVIFFPIPGIFDPFTATDFRGGVMGNEQSFDFCTSAVGPGGSRTCKFFKNKLGITTPNFNGLLHFTVIYHGKEGGSDAGGCG